MYFILSFLRLSQYNSSIYLFVSSSSLGCTLQGSIFSNAVLSGTSFAGADLTDSDFTDTYMGEFDLKNLCKNPTLSGTNPKTQAPTKESAGCK